ncbi:MAG: hypothetical protein ABJA82_00680 [Myxococcales bacterium]
MLIAWISVLVAVLGALTYALAASPKVAEMGRLAFACGLLVTLLACSGHSIHLP